MSEYLKYDGTYEPAPEVVPLSPLNQTAISIKSLIADAL